MDFKLIKWFKQLKAGKQVDQKGLCDQMVTMVLDKAASKYGYKPPKNLSPQDLVADLKRYLSTKDPRFASLNGDNVSVDDVIEQAVVGGYISEQDGCMLSMMAEK